MCSSLKDEPESHYHIKILKISRYFNSYFCQFYSISWPNKIMSGFNEISRQSFQTICKIFFGICHWAIHLFTELLRWWDLFTLKVSIVCRYSTDDWEQIVRRDIRTQAQNRNSAKSSKNQNLDQSFSRFKERTYLIKVRAFGVARMYRNLE